MSRSYDKGMLWRVLGSGDLAGSVEDVRVC